MLYLAVYRNSPGRRIPVLQSKMSWHFSFAMWHSTGCLCNTVTACNTLEGIYEYMYIYIYILLAWMTQELWSETL